MSLENCEFSISLSPCELFREDVTICVAKNIPIFETVSISVTTRVANDYFVVVIALILLLIYCC